ncbi:MAG TPA: SUF system NifU family Fe-S cluster assembly protein [Gammaproteobacteria bacterium]|nr:SUF system NifU family Fe-S cluster assembly protein [Gammaproteobacteria bacterium]
MDADLAALYRDLIIDHNRSPRNFHALDPPCRSAEGYNPLCGDRLTVYLRLDGDRIEEAAFQGSGCAISTASASLMTESLRGRTPAEARELFRDVRALLTGGDDAPAADELGKLGALAGVRAYPSRVKCATLAWHTLQSALAGDDERVTTE